MKRFHLRVWRRISALRSNFGTSRRTGTVVTGLAMLLWGAAGQAQVLSDIGATAPTPGANDIAQLLSGTANPPSLNYYWDEGHQHSAGPGFSGQSFTTGSNSLGYNLNSLAILTAGGGGNTPTRSQSFTLCIYSLSGTGYTNATLLQTYTATSQLVSEGDWMQWTGLQFHLQPNTVYAYGFGISPSSPENWEELSSVGGWPYTGGQACDIVNAGGKVTYPNSANTYDATFDIGLALPPNSPVASTPVESPSYANLAIVAGTAVTLTASASGSTPISFQWQTDGGSGGSLTNIPGAVSSNLVVNTTGWASGTYQYDFVATNAAGSSTSAVAEIVIAPLVMVDIGPNTPTPGTNDIAQLLNTAQNDDGFNYYTDDGAGHGAWAGQSFTTGSNPFGYVVNSLTWKSAGNGSSFGNYQLYDLYFYTLSGTGLTNATQIASYQFYGGGVQNDWFEIVGLNVPLLPNTAYAYTFGRDSTATGWEHIGDQGGQPYAGGQLLTIGNTNGGMVTYGQTGDSSATFDLGLSISQRPLTSAPTYNPNVNPIYAGTTITLSEAAVGGLPLSYQWFTDGGSGGAESIIPGATATNLVVNTTSFAPGNYNYQVVVTNSHGVSTSAVIALDIVAASQPILMTDIAATPGNEGYVGQTLQFDATFTGTLPIAYQWYVDTGSGPTPIPASSNPTATNNVLVLNNLQRANAGTYSVQAQNSVGGPVSSSMLTLTVLPDLAPPPAGSYGAMVLSENPVAFWPLTETNDPSTGILPAYDASGHNLDGLYGQYTGNGFDGVAGPQAPTFPGFATNNTALLTTFDQTNSWVNLPPLNLDTNAVTIAMWINPSIGGVSPFSGLLFNRNGNDAAGFGFGGTVNSSTEVAELGYTWNTNSSGTWGFNSGLYPVPGIWNFVALVVQSNQATIYLYYIDPNTGQPDLYSAVNPIPHGPEQFSGGASWLGDDEAALNRVFNGSISSAAVFNSALSIDQILALFGKGAGISEVAPTISGQPQSIGAYAGSTVHFTATGVNGSSPLAYYWSCNGTNLVNGGNISGALTSSLTISNVSAGNIGTYQLLVSNVVGTVLSSNATLLVVTPVPGSYESTVLADAPYAFWPLQETNNPALGGVLAYDFVRGLNGVYQISAENEYNGVVGPPFAGFPTNDSALETFEGTANSYVSASAGTLATNHLTYAMWIYPNGPVQNWAGLLMDRGGAGEGFGFGGAVNDVGMSELGYTWNQNSSWSWDSFLFPPTNEWSFVAMVIEPSQAVIYLFNSSGVESATNAIAQDSEEFGVAWHIGDDAQDGSGGRTFPGSIAYVSVYFSALSANQLTSLYQSGLDSLSVVSSGPQTLTLTWPQGTLLQATRPTGPWVPTVATSPYTVSTTNAQMFFKVKGTLGNH